MWENIHGQIVEMWLLNISLGPQYELWLRLDKIIIYVYVNGKKDLSARI